MNCNISCLSSEKVGEHKISQKPLFVLAQSLLFIHSRSMLKDISRAFRLVTFRNMVSKRLDCASFLLCNPACLHNAVLQSYAHCSNSANTVESHWCELHANRKIKHIPRSCQLYESTLRPWDVGKGKNNVLSWIISTRFHGACSQPHKAVHIKCLLNTLKRY